MRFHEDLFNGLVREGSYPKKSIEDAKHLLTIWAKYDLEEILKLQGIEPPVEACIVGGNGIRASPSGPAEETERLGDLLRAYREARQERRKKNLVNLLKNEPWGDRKRSLQVFQCSVCGSLSNRISSVRYRGRAFHCLGAAGDPLFHVTEKDWHRLASDKLDESRKIIHPASYRVELAREVSALVVGHPFQNDLVGDPVPRLVHFTSKGIVRCTGPEDGYAHFKDWER